MNIEPGPTDDRRRYDLAESQRGHPVHDLKLNLLGESNATSLSAPVVTHEPPIYTVLAFRVRHPGGDRVYDYAAVRAGDGRWYLTGGETKQGVSWEILVRAVRARLVGPLMVMGPVRSLFL